MREVARELIEQEQERAGDVLPWTKLTEFVERLWPVQKRQFDDAGHLPGPVFFDRGIPDALAFLSYHGAAVPAGYLEACHQCRYSLVFDLDLLPVYASEPQRPYRQAEALTLLQLNRQAYQAIGYNLISVPVLPADARVELMIARTLEWEACR